MSVFLWLIPYILLLTSLSRIFPPPGLDNLGSTCYANAILHSLFFLPELWKLVQVSLSDTPMLKELRAILMVLNSSRCAVKPRKFLLSLQAHIVSFQTTLPRSRRFSHNCQQDAFEVLGYITAEMQRVYQRPDLLSIGVSRLATCLTCVYDQDVQTDASEFLTIPFASSIQNSIHKYLGEQVKRKCWQCGTNRKCAVVTTFTKLPKILILRVNRCSFGKETGEHTKASAQINCNQEISLPLGNEGPTTAYKISSIIHHIGTSSGGHYTATLFDPATGRMWNCDDNKVKPTGSIDQTSASILIYRKVE